MVQSDEKIARSVSRLRRFASLLDSSIRLPGGYRIGISGIIGLIPGVGDVLAAMLTASIILAAVRLKVSGSVLVRMLLNMAVDFLIGLVPVVGDLADFVFKANERNVRLLDAYEASPRRTTVASRWLLLTVIGALLLLLTFATLAGIAVARFVWAAIAG